MRSFFGTFVTFFKSAQVKINYVGFILNFDQEITLTPPETNHILPVGGAPRHPVSTTHKRRRNYPWLPPGGSCRHRRLRENAIHDLQTATRRLLPPLSWSPFLPEEGFCSRKVQRRNRPRKRLLPWERLLQSRWRGVAHRASTTGGVTPPLQRICNQPRPIRRGRRLDDPYL